MTEPPPVAVPNRLPSGSVAGLTSATAPEVVTLRDGDTLDLDIRPVRKRLGDTDVAMLAYGGSVPGQTLVVSQGSTATVNVHNHTDLATTVHWHGLRLENRYDGVPGETQPPIRPGESFSYRLRFPDPGLYWYHPHLREDIAQELGLYGTIVVEPAEPSYWPAVDRQLTLTLDDLLIEDGRIVPFGHPGPNFVAMGRFGNVLLVNGETAFSAPAVLGEVVRLHLVNTANTRLFNVALRGARMKLVGGDSGRYEHETFVDAVLLAPSERAIVDVHFDRPGAVRLEHRTPNRVVDLGGFSVAGTGTGDAAATYDRLRIDPELAAERRSLPAQWQRAPDKTLVFVASMPLLYGHDVPDPSRYACPMHPEVIGREPATCPICGMSLVGVKAESSAPAGYVCPMHPGVTGDRHERCPRCGMELVPQHVAPAQPDDHHHAGDIDHDGLEWEDLMPAINRASDAINTRWKLVDRDTGAENDQISWVFITGQKVKIRLVNTMESDHPMHHPFHIHGAGRFLILARDGEPEANLVWKDTVLLRAGETVDILFHATNPGRWMAHCHIAEHTEGGMMLGFEVIDRRP